MRQWTEVTAVRQSHTTYSPLKIYSGTDLRSENNSPNGDNHMSKANAAANAGRREGLSAIRNMPMVTPSSVTPVLEAERTRATRNNMYTTTWKCLMGRRIFRRDSSQTQKVNTISRLKGTGCAERPATRAYLSYFVASSALPVKY